MNFTEIKREKKIAAAVSGGIDSMVLLHQLISVKDKKGFQLCVVHVDHNLRKTSKNDCEFVKKFCEKNKIEFICFSVDVKDFAKTQKVSEETAARTLRYMCFDKVEADYIALAHHRSDQAETVLLHLIRGSGLNGVVGMKRLNEKYLRPMLNMSKKEIASYQKKHQVPFVVDETNSSNDYSRNYLRNEIMPLFKKINENTEENIALFAERAAEDENFMRDCALQAGMIKYNDYGVELKEKVFSMAPSVWKRCIFEVFKLLKINSDIFSNHVEILSDFSLKGKNGGRLDMPFGVTVWKEYEKLVFCKNIANCKSSMQVPFCVGKSSFSNKVINISQGEGLFRFDLNKIPADAVFRFKQDGDVFEKFGGGRKKLNDYLTDKKVPQRIRDNLVVIASGQQILYIENIETSGKIWVDNDTCNAYSIAIECIAAEE